MRIAIVSDAWDPHITRVFRSICARNILPLSVSYHWLRWFHGPSKAVRQSRKGLMEGHNGHRISTLNPAGTNSVVFNALHARTLFRRK